jgi:hypothetical protein
VDREGPYLEAIVQPYPGRPPALAAVEALENPLRGARIQGPAGGGIDLQLIDAHPGGQALAGRPPGGAPVRALEHERAGAAGQAGVHRPWRAGVHRQHVDPPARAHGRAVAHADPGRPKIRALEEALPEGRGIEGLARAGGKGQVGEGLRSWGRRRPAPRLVQAPVDPAICDQVEAAGLGRIDQQLPRQKAVRRGGPRRAAVEALEDAPGGGGRIDHVRVAGMNRHGRDRQGRQAVAERQPGAPAVPAAEHAGPRGAHVQDGRVAGRDLQRGDRPAERADRLPQLGLGPQRARGEERKKGCGGQEGEGGSGWYTHAGDSGKSGRRGSPARVYGGRRGCVGATATLSAARSAPPRRGSPRLAC